MISALCHQVLLITSFAFNVNAAIFADGDQISLKAVGVNNWCSEESGDKVRCTSADQLSTSGYVFKVKVLPGGFHGIQGLFNGLTQYCVSYATEMKCNQNSYLTVEASTKFIFEAGTGTNILIKQGANYCTVDGLALPPNKITCLAAKASALTTGQWEVCVWDAGLTKCAIPASLTGAATTPPQPTTITTSTTSTFTTSTTSTTTAGICTVPDPVAKQNATLVGGLVQVDDYACEHRNHFVSLDLAIEACKGLADCQAVSNTQCDMQNLGGVVGLCRGGSWINRTGDCIYMKDTR